MTDYIIGKDPSKCYGCGGCEKICPKGAIALKPNNEGFLYPVFDEEKCIKCGLCKKACPNDNEIAASMPKSVYAFQYKNKQKLFHSASGGVFISLADYVLENGGYVCGCIFNEDKKVVHTVTNDPHRVSLMQGSKYVQSEMGDCYLKTKELLDSGKTVLFSATPCQIDGLNRFLRKEYDNLITMDIICHGVPSPSLFKLHIDMMGKKLGNITNVSFRDKAFAGWGCGKIGSISYHKGDKEKKLLISAHDDGYYQLFNKDMNFRHSCYQCKFASPERVSDFTAGDYWGIKNVLPNLNCTAGMSVMLVNSEKAEKLLSLIKDRVSVYETDYDSARKSNGNLSHPTPKPATRDSFYKDVGELGYERTVKKNCRFKRFIPKVKRMVKKILNARHK